MKITNEMYDKIKNCFPKHRKTPRYSNLEVLNAMLYELENGCKWIGKSRGSWNTKIHMVAASERNAVKFTLSSGEKHDAPENVFLMDVNV